MALKRKRKPSEILASTSRRFGDHTVRCVLRQTLDQRGRPTDVFRIEADAMRPAKRGDRWQPIPLSWRRLWLGDRVECP